MIIKHIFFINGAQVEPYYTDDLVHDNSIEPGACYFNSVLVGNIKLIGKWYDWLDAQDFNTKFFFEVFEDTGSSFQSIYKGSFMKTDCVWNIDDKQVLLKLTTDDGYDKIKAILDKEVNLVDLMADVEKANYVSRPIMQYYIPGKPTVTNFSNNAYWEEDVREEVADTARLENEFFFKTASELFLCSISGSCSPDVTGGDAGSAHTSPAFSSGNKYRIDFDLTGGEISVWDHAAGIKLYEDHGPFINDFPYTIELSPVGTATGNPVVVVNYYRVYSRLLTNVLAFNATPTYAIPTLDIVEPHRNFKYCLGATYNTIIASAESTDTPDKYGRNDFRKYFLPPAIAGRFFMPFSMSYWGNVSFWFDPIYLIPNFDILGSTDEVLVDAYPLHSVLSKILEKFSTGITFNESIEHSEFLYAPVCPVPNVDKFSLLITQKTNLMINGYDKAAQKAPIKLKDIFDILEGLYKCYWDVYDGKLRLELSYWYKNGHSYSGTPEIGLDLEYKQDPRNRKTIGFGQNQYYYDKSSMPERIQFSWQEEVSDAFDGYPIDVINDYVSKGLIQNVNLSNVVTDFDYLLQNYRNMSSDGLAILSCRIVNLFNPASSGNLYNARLDYTTGDYVTDQEYNVTHWMPVEKDHMYIVSYKHSITFVDEFGVFISGISETDPGTAIIPPVNATLMRCTVSKSAWEAYSVTDGYVKYTVPLVDTIIKGTTFKLQNGDLSWVNLHSKYYIYDAPARILKINEVQVEASSTVMSKVQSVVYPSAGVDHSKRIKTSIGVGFVQKFSLNLSSGISKTTLLYETE